MQTQPLDQSKGGIRTMARVAYFQLSGPLPSYTLDCQSSIEFSLGDTGQHRFLHHHTFQTMQICPTRYGSILLERTKRQQASANRLDMDLVTWADHRSSFSFIAIRLEDRLNFRSKTRTEPPSLKDTHHLSKRSTKFHRKRFSWGMRILSERTIPCRECRGWSDHVDPVSIVCEPKPAL
jgi:hypothetical protein